MRIGFALRLACFGLGAALAPAHAQSVKLSPVESYTVVYSVSGAQSGTLTEYSRGFGIEQVQENDLTLPGGLTSRVRLITRADIVVSYDPTSNRAGSIANPSYARLAATAAGKDGRDLTNALLQSLTFVPTGRMENYAGEACMVWESSQLSQTRCVTPDGIAVHMRIAAQGVEIERTAQSVARGEPGPDSVYAPPDGVNVAPVASMNLLPGLGG